ncbi:MAG TPA: hypothetical protein VM261_12175 [Kofleriaceae bacterium]|nr:hypothetical protein [Kofleriaceae bacterium]
MHRAALATVLVAALAALAACGDDVAGDPFPIAVDRAGGAFVVGLKADGDQFVRTAVVDVLSPLTILDQAAEVAPARRSGTLDLMEPEQADGSRITRVRWDATVLGMHPCASGAPCEIGAAGQPLEIGAVIGGDILRRNAITFEPRTDTMYVLPDVAGDNETRGDACEVVVPRPFYGGGTLRIGDTEVGFAGTRVALGVCLSPDPDAPEPKDRGTDAALVLSTGIGLSIIGEARYAAWADANGGPALSTLPPAFALLPSGLVQGRLGRIDRLAIVGTSTAPRGACREVFAHHLLSDRNCAPTDGDDCPCENDSSCQVAAIAEISPATPIEVVVVPDEDPLLQSLRAELRPEQPEVDGILGMNALATTAFDVDYPNNRLLFRCVAAGCVARPALLDGKRPVVAACVAAAPTVP